MLPPAPARFSTMNALAERLAELGRERARQDVGRAARRERHDDADRFGRPSALCALQPAKATRTGRRRPRRGRRASDDGRTWEAAPRRPRRERLRECRECASRRHQGDLPDGARWLSTKKEERDDRLRRWLSNSPESARSSWTARPARREQVGLTGSRPDGARKRAVRSAQGAGTGEQRELARRARRAAEHARPRSERVEGRRLGANDAVRLRHQRRAGRAVGDHGEAASLSWRVRWRRRRGAASRRHARSRRRRTTR